MPEALDHQTLERGSTDLRIQWTGQLIVRQADIEQRSEERRAGRQFRIECRELPCDDREGVFGGGIRRNLEKRTPDRDPDRIAGFLRQHRTITGERRESQRAGLTDHLRQQTRFADAWFGDD